MKIKIYLKDTNLIEIDVMEVHHYMLDRICLVDHDIDAFVHNSCDLLLDTIDYIEDDSEYSYTDNELALAADLKRALGDKYISRHLR